MFQSILKQLRALVDLSNNLRFALSDITDLRDRVRQYHETLVRLVNRPYPVIVSIRAMAYRAQSDLSPAALGGLYWLIPGEERIISLQPDAHLSNIEVECIGGIMSDVKIGYNSQLAGWCEQSAVTKVKCSDPSTVGQRITVTLRLPQKDSPQ